MKWLFYSLWFDLRYRLSADFRELYRRDREQFWDRELGELLVSAEFEAAPSLNADPQNARTAQQK